MSFSASSSAFRVPSKPALPIGDQLALLRRRGLEVDDSCAEFLRAEGYYRFSGFARQFQIDPSQAENRFVEGTTFADIRGAMQSDDQLSRLLLPALLRSERLIRGHLAYELGTHHGSAAFYLEENAYISGLDKASGLADAFRTRLLNSPHRGVQRYINGDDCSALPV